MKIRNWLTFLFTVVVASILGLFSLSVYYLSAKYRENEFYSRLRDKARTTATLLIEIDEVDDNLLKIIDRNDLTSLPKEQVVIYNYLNQIIYDSDENPRDSAASKELLNQIRLEKEVRFTEGEYEVVGIVFNYNYERYVVIASALDQYGLSKLNNLRLIMAAGLLGSLVIVAVTGWIFAGRAVYPISDIVDQVGRISYSNLSLRVQEGNGKDEIARLAVTFNQMLDRLQQAIETQKSFVANASHELRTPLTIITSQIEVTLIRRRTIEEYEGKLRAILTDINYLNKLSNDLLEMAQVSVNAMDAQLQPVQVDEIIYQAALNLSSKHPAYYISFAFEEKETDAESGFIILGDETLLKTAFVNLMENACKFSNNNQVKVVLGVDQDQVKIQFIDQGIGISSHDLVHIFEPFYRAENTRKIKGHGIGLSLTQKIIALHKGTITVSSVLHQGTNFSVWLPLHF